MKNCKKEDAQLNFKKPGNKTLVKKNSLTGSISNTTKPTKTESKKSLISTQTNATPQISIHLFSNNKLKKSSKSTPIMTFNVDNKLERKDEKAREEREIFFPMQDEKEVVKKKATQTHTTNFCFKRDKLKIDKKSDLFRKSIGGKEDLHQNYLLNKLTSTPETKKGFIIPSKVVELKPKNKKLNSLTIKTEGVNLQHQFFHTPTNSAPVNFKFNNLNNQNNNVKNTTATPKNSNYVLTTNYTENNNKETEGTEINEDLISNSQNSHLKFHLNDSRNLLMENNVIRRETFIDNHFNKKTLSKEHEEIIHDSNNRMKKYEILFDFIHSNIKEITEIVSQSQISANKEESLVSINKADMQNIQNIEKVLNEEKIIFPDLSQSFINSSASDMDFFRQLVDQTFTQKLENISNEMSTLHSKIDLSNMNFSMGVDRDKTQVDMNETKYINIHDVNPSTYDRKKINPSFMLQKLKNSKISQISAKEEANCTIF